jgi:glycosyltransferase involved in cell wall biosynthesis
MRRDERALVVAHALDSLHTGGSEWQAVSLAAGLDPARYRSIMVSLSAGGGLAESLTRADITTEFRAFRGFRHPGAAGDLLGVARILRRYRTQVAQSYGFYSNVPLMLAARIARVPVRVASRRDMGEFLTPTFRLLERVAFRLADRVVVNAQAIRQELVSRRQTTGAKIAVIPTGVDVARFDAVPGSPWPAASRAGGRKVVCMVARFRRQKDHPTFLRAVQQVIKEGATASFVLAGDGHLRGRVEELSRNLGLNAALRFAGGVSPDAMPRFLRQVDIAVLASRGNEGIPNVVLEAMAAGKPVVATDTGGCREAVLDGITGFLVPPGDVEALAQRVRRLLGDDATAEQMGRAGRRRVETEFSMDAMIAGFSSLYDGLAGQKLGARTAPSATAPPSAGRARP